MQRNVHHRVPWLTASLALALASLILVALTPMHSQAQSGTATTAQSVPNMDQTITPLLPQGAQFGPLIPGLAGNPTWQVGQAVSTVVSPDHNTLLILTSGFNRLFNADVVPPGGSAAQYNMAESNEYVFVYDISGSTPVQKQPPLQIPITYHGMVFDPSGTRFDVSGCTTDNVHVITQSATGWAESPANPPLALGHSLGNGLNLKPNGATAINSQVGVYPCSAGLAISGDGQTLVVANYYNDSITVFSGGYPFQSRRELDLRPGKTNPALAGVPGGEYPFWVAVKGTGANTTPYVSSIRDREIVVANVAGAPSIAARIPVKGQPNKMTLNAAQSLLFVAGTRLTQSM